MSNKLNLLLLHEEQDSHPRSWICLKGRDLDLVIDNLEKEVLGKFKITREELSRRLGKKLNCSHHAIKRILHRKNYFPIIVILSLLEHSKHKSRFIKKINSETEWIKVNSASAKPVKACKKITIDLAKVVGAFMADGSLHISTIFSAKDRQKLNNIRKEIQKAKIKYSEHYSKSRREFYIAIVLNRSNYDKVGILIKKFSKYLTIQRHANIELIDQYKNDVKKFNKWVFLLFGIKPLKFRKRGNAWRTYFCSKILSRYLIIFLGLKPGKKSDIAFEPMSIQNSSLKIRKAFAKGVLMFDGCVTLAGKIVLESRSQLLIKSVADIWSRDGIEFTADMTRGVVYSTSKNTLEKIKQYFEEGTVKYDRLHMVWGDERTENKLDGKSENVSLEKIFAAVKEAKTCDIAFITNKFDIKHNTASMYLKVLEKNKKIRLTSKPEFLDVRFIDKKTGLLLEEQTRDRIFKKIKKKFGHYKNAAVFLDINKCTFSAWKVGRNRIPVEVVEKIAKITDMDAKEAYNNIVSTDRMICSLP